MKIIKTNPKHPQPKVIDEAVEVLRHGGVLIYPTDTCYALGVDMGNLFAVEKIYRIKGREARKPLSIIVKNLAYIEKIALVEEEQKKILSQYLPGPFTFVMLNIDYRTFRQPTIGIRIPDYKITQQIAEKFHRAFSTTSANRSGQTPCYSVAAILQQFRHNEYLPDLILDAGVLAKNPPSTVVDVTGKIPRVLREGGIKFDYKK